MKQEEKESLQEFLEGKIDLGLIPAGVTIQGLQDWALGYMACTVKIREWAAEQEAKETTRFQEILESVDAGKRQRPEPWTEKEMSGEEDRDQIVRILQELIQHTRAGAELVALRRIPGKDPAKYESVEAEFMSGGKKRQGIEEDSGIAIIRDVLKMF